MTLIAQKDYVRMAWKNGLGHTEQIAIWPPESKFPLDKFDWRLSSATISSSNSFSNFPGYDRWLTVIEGNGVRLGNQILRYGECVHFSGEMPVTCELIQEPVVDLGIIFDRSKLTVKMEFVRSGPGSYSPAVPGDFDLFFVSRGQLSCGSTSAQMGETLFVENGASTTFLCSAKSEFVRTTITKLNLTAIG